jgi:hypothetical protein
VLLFLALLTRVIFREMFEAAAKFLDFRKQYVVWIPVESLDVPESGN